MKQRTPAWISPENLATVVGVGVWAAVALSLLFLSFGSEWLGLFAQLWLLQFLLSGLSLTFLLFYQVRSGKTFYPLTLGMMSHGLSLVACLLQLFYFTQSQWGSLLFGLHSVVLVLHLWLSYENQSHHLESGFQERFTLNLLFATGFLSFIIWQWQYQDLNGYEESSLNFASVFYLCLFLHPFLIWVIRELSLRSKPLQKRPWGKNLVSYFRREPEKTQYYLWHWLFSGLGLLISEILRQSPEYLQDIRSQRVLFACFAIHSLPKSFLTFKIWRDLLRYPRRWRQGESLAELKMENYLLQYHQRHFLPQTSLGVRTAVLFVDHDPSEDCRLHLPSFFYRARQQQCELILNRLFSEQFLSFQSQGSEILVAIAPEKSVRSCTDSLIMLTALYLDALPLVEKRLKQLVRLLPLLDIELSKLFSEQRVEQLFSRLHGFFHLDFRWIDQTMQARDDVEQYDVRLENLNPKERQRVLTQLSSAQWLGNFIWISESARDRIRSESPFLASIIERWPIQIDGQFGKSSESSVYLIKFENLIPRLQRYHKLDQIRSQLVPMAMDESLVGVCQKIESILQKDPDVRQLRALLKSISQNEWQGFRAKDQALDYLLKIMQIAEDMEKSLRLPHADCQNLRLEIKDIVQAIGYPCQDIHKAHLAKIELRQMGELQRIALEPGHMRCKEAWLLLSSQSFHSLPYETAIQLLQTISTACSIKALSRQRFYLQKIIEAFYQVARTLPHSRDNDISRVFQTLIRTLLLVEADRELLVAFMDGKLALDQNRGQELRLAHDLIDSWNKAMNGILNDPDLLRQDSEAIELRWRAFIGSLSMEAWKQGA